MNLKHIIYIVTLATFLLASPLMAHERLVVAVDHAPPYSYTLGETRPRGLLIDIMMRISKQLNVSLQLIPCPVSRCVQLIRSGQADIGGAFIKTPERERDMVFLDPAYMVLNSPFVFYAQTETDISVNTYQDLYGKRIGIVRGAAHFTRFDNDKKLNKIAVQSERVAMDLLLKGRLDVVIGVEQTADHSLSVLNQPSHRLKKLNYRHDEPILGFAVASKRSENQKLITRVQQALLDLANSGELTQLVDIYDLPPVIIK
ncbi:substrate-binding periplasmic protein [Pseudoalteromonas sp.]|uniref:substrate-binding periplasmic protein n=1 Tax=Pseudoalteromonas sp. TaxID=53249 RepID=UPI0035667916